MFQRAEPEEPGLGVMISTPGLTRSSQVSMPSGLPSRTTKTTTEEVAMPLVGVVLPVLGHQALADQTGHVGLQRVVHDVGVGAGHDGAALVAGGAVRRLELDAVAGGGVLEVLEDRLVGRLHHGERIDRHRVATGGVIAVSWSSNRSRPAPRLVLLPQP